MRIQYIGKQPRHTDRLFGTFVRWSGPGDVQEVPDEEAVQMVAEHPTVYAVFEPSARDTREDWDKEKVIEYMEATFGVRADKRRSRERLLQDLAELEG